VTGRASGLKKIGCQFVGGDDLTGALHVLQLQLSDHWREEVSHSTDLCTPSSPTGLQT